MRLKKTKLRNQGRRIALGITTLGLVLFGLSTVQRFLLERPRLLSIQEIPEIGESCSYPAGRTAPEQSLFPAFEQTAYDQDANTVELNRPPVRDILDTAPIFSSVGVDATRNEVYLQDSPLEYSSLRPA
jgi:hypothetical protein